MPSHHDGTVHVPVTTGYKYPGWMETVQTEHLSGEDCSVGPAGFGQVVTVCHKQAAKKYFVLLEIKMDRGGGSVLAGLKQRDTFRPETFFLLPAPSGPFLS